jgi:hypothetical protein
MSFWRNMLAKACYKTENTIAHKDTTHESNDQINSHAIAHYIFFTLENVHRAGRSKKSSWLGNPAKPEATPLRAAMRGQAPAC